MTYNYNKDQTTTTTNSKPKEISLDKIKKAAILLGSVEDMKEREKALGMQAMNFKCNYSKRYKELGDEDKMLIDNIVDRQIYRQKKEMLTIKPVVRTPYFHDIRI